ncbi:MAG: NAD(P)-dependent oxidoreductase [Proteobacteria bacterium]|nr:NAD(P)-dependent oxidoreductase [Pseudomonadota bacterium]
MTTHIGFLGTGLMGAPMAANLLKAGFTLTVWNRTEAKTKALADAGAKIADTPAGVAEGADTVIVMLENGPVVTEVLFGRGVADALAPGSLVIDMASIPPATARDHARRLKKKSIGHLDAPVSGGTRGAADAALAIMAGGTPEDFARASEIFQALGRATHVGPAGAGELAKCTNQVIVAITIGAVAEGLLLAAAGGADPAAVRQAITGGFADSRILQEHGRRMIERDFVPGGPIRMHMKDLNTALDAAAEASLALPITSMIKELFQALLDAGGNEFDHSALLLALERQSPGIRLGDGPDKLP